MSEARHIVSITSIRSRTGEHIHSVLSNKSELRAITIDPSQAHDEDDLLAEIGYKQELKREYSTIQIFGIAFSIMGLLPSISSTIGSGLEAGPVGLVWGWFTSSFFILCVGISMSILSSSLPTSGGLYYWTNYYAPDSIRVPLSFVIGCSNTLGLTSGFCSINYGFASELLAAIYINRDGDLNITNSIRYGVFAATCISHIIVSSIASRQTAWLQTFSIIINLFVIALFLIAVPIGAARGIGFNSGHYIFGELLNARTWSPGWSFMLSWMPAIWTIGGFDSCVHMSEEARNATRGVPIGIIGSIITCWVLGWAICIVSCAVIKDGDVEAVITTGSGQAMAQIIYDALGKKWAVAFMSLIAFAQYLMGASILTASSRQIWAFARDDGLPFHNFVKVVNPTLKVPLRAILFGGTLGLLCGLLILIGPVAANALFSLSVASNGLAWGMPAFLVLLPHGSKRFRPGYFYLGKIGTTAIHAITSIWIAYVIFMSMFPDGKSVDKNTMNYTCVINVGLWILSLTYYFTFGYRFYSGPKSNLDDSSSSIEVENIDVVLGEKES
ncbi:GABA-specific permease [[Candida] anglica]|uniref:GABA-specific permease n=1 Tax=[Candida] anglica TaxID=148631 RepID=A0ABP0ELS7_9ASCO